MKMRNAPVLDPHNLTVVVLFFIVASGSAWVFVRQYFLEPARAAKRVERRIEALRARGPAPDVRPSQPPPPGTPLYERWQHGQQYLRTGDEQAKQWVCRDEKRRWRAKHWLAIWGSFAAVCISTTIVVSVGLPMLRERRA